MTPTIPSILLGLLASLPVSSASTHEAIWDGPAGCWETTGELSWEHASAALSWTGRADIHATFQNGIWRFPHYDIVEESSLPRHQGEASFAPMMMGILSEIPIRRWEQGRHWFEWPAPVATDQARVRSHISVSSVDQAARGMVRVHQSEHWDGYASVHLDRQVEFDPQGRAQGLLLKRNERRRGCRVRRIGRAQLSTRGIAAR